MPFDIEKNVPTPPRREGGGRPEKYPWRAMEVGDSFFVPGVTSGGMSSVSGKADNRLGIKTVARTVTENGVTGTRVWRVE